MSSHYDRLHSPFHALRNLLLDSRNNPLKRPVKPLMKQHTLLFRLWKPLIIRGSELEV